MKHIQSYENFQISESSDSAEDLLKKMNALAKKKYGEKEYLTVSHKKAIEEIDGYKELYNEYKRLNKDNK